jgi:hypothetical protein
MSTIDHHPLAVACGDERAGAVLNVENFQIHAKPLGKA